MDLPDFGTGPLGLDSKLPDCLGETIQQLREAFPGESAVRFLIHDNDCIFSDRVAEAIGQLGIESKRTAYRSPCSMTNHT